MPSQSAQNKRSAPLPTPTATKSGAVKSSNGKSSKGNSKTTRNSPGSNANHPVLNAPVTDPAKASKKVAKAVRSSKQSKSSKTKTKEKVGDGPEAELSENDGASVVDDIEDGEDDTTPEPEERALLVGSGNPGGSGPKEISMHTLIAGAKPKVDDHKISRGYEFVPSPASRLVIPAESTLQYLPHRLRGRDRGNSLASSACLSDDSGWEEIQFEMDVDAFGDEEMSLSTRDLGRKRAYADVVRGSFVPLVGARA